MDHSIPTFSEPPALDAVSIDILQAISRNGIHNPNHPLFVFMDANGEKQVINWGQAVKAFNVACRYTLHHVDQGYSTARVSSRVVGILANLDSITFYSLIIGIMKAGFIPFLISSRNSAANVAHLLNATNCNIIFTSEDSPTRRLVDSSISFYESQNPGKERVRQILAPSFQHLFYAQESESKEVETDLSRDVNTPCIIFHSSGTVNFPKPAFITHRMFMELATTPRLEGHWRGKVTSVHILPMFHVMGVVGIAFSATLGSIMSVFRPSQPPILPSPELVLQEALLTSSTHIWCVPSVLETWASNPQSISKLKKFSEIMYGGGPLQSRVGNLLEEHLRTVVPHYGTTETGPVSTFFPQYGKREGWSALIFNKHIDCRFIKEDEEEGTYRLVVMKNAVKTPAVLNTEIDGVPGFDTGDLYTKHPYVSGAWRIYGRADDQIMHSTGEKTNPGPIETGLTSSPYISGALMFGRAQFRPGVLIAPSADHKFDYRNAQQRNDYTKLIWSAIEVVNGLSPQHSRIFEDMIIFTDADRPIEYTGKGTVRRKATLKKYAKEIESLYSVNEPQSPSHSDDTAFDAPLITANKKGTLDTSRNGMDTFSEVFRIVRDSVTGILGSGVHDEDDIFSAGADSLCAISIRNSLVQKLKSETPNSSQVVSSLPQDILYVLPSMSKLAAFIYGLIHSDCHRLTNLGPISKPSKLQITDSSKVVEVQPEPSVQEMMDRKWQSIMESKETVVEIAPVSSTGESPLLLFHGAPGSLETFPMFMQCSTGVWGVQVTDEAPQDSLVDLAQFYYRKIKEKQPHGPYRLAAYSGTIVLVLVLVLLFQKSRDPISQFAMLDHFPTYYFPSHDPSAVDLDSDTWLDSHTSDTIRSIMKMVESIPGELGVQAAVRNRDLKRALDGEGTPAPMAARLIRRTKALIKMSLGYLLDERFMVASANSNKKVWSPELFREFVKQVEPTLSMYVAKAGVRYWFSPELMEIDLGARRYFPRAKVYTFDGGHLDFLGNEELLKMIQMDYDM